ncbi:YqaA family protein [Thalassospira australica]|uniref:YqaA family protein n=1 Tax=Thalassospira australica TaxID=1528106 RepID=UPI000519F67D|nr:VTT domain-containing protein [Thalassospira australica]
MTKTEQQTASGPKSAMKYAQKRLAQLAEGRKGLWGISGASFLETTIIPIPIEIIIAPIMAASRTRGFIVATVTLAGSVAGALALYLLARVLFDDVAQPLIDLLGGQQEFKDLQDKFEQGGFWVVFAISITPVPMQLAALAAGAASYPVWLFVIAITASRALRYYGLWLLVLGFGTGIARIFEGRKPKLGADHPS